MELTVKLNMDNDAFKHDTDIYLEEILAQIGTQIRDGRTEAKIYDYNGNNVGQWEIK